MTVLRQEVFISWREEAADVVGATGRAAVSPPGPHSSQHLRSRLRYTSGVTLHTVPDLATAIRYLNVYDPTEIDSIVTKHFGFVCMCVILLISHP